MGVTSCLVNSVHLEIKELAYYPKKKHFAFICCCTIGEWPSLRWRIFRMKGVCRGRLCYIFNRQPWEWRIYRHIRRREHRASYLTSVTWVSWPSSHNLENVTVLWILDMVIHVYSLSDEITPPKYREIFSKFVGLRCSAFLYFSFLTVISHCLPKESKLKMVKWRSIRIQYI